jgi:hypothetical protein
LTFRQKDAVEDKENSSKMRDLAKPHPDASNLTFIIWAAIVSIGLIILSIAFGVGIDPDMSILTSP